MIWVMDSIPWVRCASGNVFLIPTLPFFRHFETLYQDISVVEGRSLEKLTGCKKPCRYRKYEVIGDKSPTSFRSEHFTISFWAVSNETTVWTEVPVYPWTSLVAEFGGTLSLFLGFSFMTVWGGLKKLLSLLWSRYGS